MPNPKRKLRREGVDYVMSDSKRELYFKIENCDVADADRLKKTSCVVARALEATLPKIRRVEVGATVTYIFFEPAAGRKQGDVMRYDTTPILREALSVFDKTGDWNLPLGVYNLVAPRRRLGGRRHEYIDSETGRLNSALRGQRPKRTGKHTLKHINPRLIEFRETQA